MLNAPFQKINSLQNRVLRSENSGAEEIAAGEDIVALASRRRYALNGKDCAQI
jgi:hypothetical protein